MRILPAITVAAVLGLAARVVNARASSEPRPGPPFPSRRRDFGFEQGRAVLWEAGSGPPVLLLHGIYAGASAYEWRRVAPALARSHRVIAPDLPGFGASDRLPLSYSAELYVEFLRELRDRVCAEPPLVIATTFSAAYAVAAAAAPGFASGLVLACPTGLEGAGPPARLSGLLQTVLSLPGLGDAAVLLLGRRRTVGRYFRNYVYFEDGLIEAEELAYTRAQVLQPGARFALAAYLAGALNLDIRAELAALRVPVQVVWGRQAEFTPVEQARAFLTVQPDARLEVIERCGNAPHLERPDEFLRIVDGLSGLG